MVVTDVATALGYKCHATEPTYLYATDAHILALIHEAGYLTSLLCQIEHHLLAHVEGGEDALGVRVAIVQAVHRMSIHSLSPYAHESSGKLIFVSSRLWGHQIADG